LLQRVSAFSGRYDEPVIELADLYLTKALESLAGAESELANLRFNNCANRANYACFQAAIAALWRAGVRPPGSDGEWSHSFVASQFDGLLIHRRKLYPAELRGTLDRVRSVRLRADYQHHFVSEVEMQRTIRRARVFVDTIKERGGSTR
jgi:uncharacterized protein (UPF0332 family)